MKQNLIRFETQLNELQSQKNNLESELSDTKVQFIRQHSTRSNSKT